MPHKHTDSNSFCHDNPVAALAAISAKIGADQIFALFTIKTKKKAEELSAKLRAAVEKMREKID